MLYNFGRNGHLHDGYAGDRLIKLGFPKHLPQKSTVPN